MGMSFQEKSAWGSLIAIGLVAYWFFPVAFDIAGNSSDPSDLFALSIACIIALLIAVWILFTLTVSEFAKLASQVWYYRVDAA